MKSLSGKTILLTGATGFIGSHLATRLKQIPDIKLVLLSRKSVSETNQNVVIVSCPLDELTRQTWLNQGIEKIEIVFHLGAFTPKRSSEGDLVEPVYRDNLNGTRALLESLPAVPERIVFASTLDVYAPPPDNYILTELSPIGPPSLYGASKLFCEHLVKAYARQCNCGYAILRYGHIYGPGEEAYAKIIPQAIKSLLRNESPVIYGDGSVKRDFLFVGDAVEATIRAAAGKHRSTEAVNIVSGDSKTIREYVVMLVGLIGYRGEIKYLLDKPAGRSLKFSNDRMFDVLGRWGLCPLEEGMRQEISYFEKQQ
jgi:nucleoside-diphosphate-sugar epimerase